MQACEREPERPSQNEFTPPKLVKAACIIWIIEGCIYLFIAAALVVGGVIGGLKGDFSAVLWGLFFAAVVGLFGYGFVYVSIQTFRGKARDTLWTGIASLILGLYDMLPRGIFRMSGAPFKMDVWVLLLSCAPLLLAGILALLGRTRYKAWREMQHANRAAENRT